MSPWLLLTEGKRKELLAIMVHGIKEMPADVTTLITKHITNKPKNITEIEREIKSI